MKDAKKKTKRRKQRAAWVQRWSSANRHLFLGPFERQLGWGDAEHGNCLYFRPHVREGAEAEKFLMDAARVFANVSGSPISSENVAVPCD